MKDTAKATSLAGQALKAAQAAENPQDLAHAHNVLGILSLDEKDYQQMKVHLERSLVLSEEIADPGVKVAALNNLSLMYRDMGDLERARDLAKEALDLCVQQGDRHREAALLNNLADLYHASGDYETDCTGQ